ncbi:MAG: ORF6N domain-containing protein [Candidatus Omnitrophota bacterium]|nr:ORF6N domain-containing protein [Candidatus Omnitrophota bacterium]
MAKLISVEVIATKILEVRGKRVMFDADLARLYDVSTKVFNQAVKRNQNRFPEDFMFQLAKEEFGKLKCHFETSSLRSQFVTSKRGGRRYLPYVFTQEGVAMLSSVLNSRRAIRVNILIMRAFVKLKELLLTHRDLSVKIEALERKYVKHDEKIKDIFKAIRQLMAIPEKPKRRIGFHVESSH